MPVGAIFRTSFSPAQPGAVQCYGVRRCKSGSRATGCIAAAGNVVAVAPAAGRRERAGAPEGRLVEISGAALNTSPPAATVAVSLQLHNGATLQIAPGTDPVWLGSLVSALVSAGA